MSNLGKFIREFVPEKTEQYEEPTVYYVRGLTVAEYIDLIEQMGGGIQENLFTNIALTTIEGWENLQDQSGGQIDYKEGREGWLKDETLIKIGDYAYNQLTVLGDERESKMRGFVNFLYWKSQDENQGRAKFFNCEKCLSSGKAVSRNCGKFSMEYRKNYNKDSDDSDDLTSKKKKKSRKSYSSRRTFMSPDQFEEANNLASKNDELVLNDFRFPECPVSWIDDHLKILCETLYHAEKSDRNFFSGGVADQPYQVYKASVVIKNEYNRLEKEEMEEQKSSTQKKASQSVNSSSLSGKR